MIAKDKGRQRSPPAFPNSKAEIFRYCGKGRRNGYNTLSKTALNGSRQRKAGHSTV